MKTERRKSPPRARRKSAAARRPSSGVGSRLLIMAAVVAAVVFGVAIFFKVNTVEVQGNTIYSASEISAASGIQKGDNLFTLNKEAAAGSIKANLPYVESVSVIRFLPDKIVIEVKESDAAFAVTTNVNTTWLINSVGKALEQVADSTLTDAAQGTEAPETGADESATGEEAEPTQDGAGQSIPRILGVVVNSPTAGAVVTAENGEQLSAALAVIAQLEGTGILEHIETIDVEKEYDIVLEYDGRYEIRLGGTEELSYKIDYLTVILDNLSDFQAGIIDLTFSDSSEARFYSKE